MDQIKKLYIKYDEKPRLEAYNKRAEKKGNPQKKKNHVYFEYKFDEVFV